MRVLFLHDAFPAQFGHVALELTRRYGWECRFLVESVSNCPAPSAEMLRELDVRSYPLSDEYRRRPPTPWPQIYGKYLELCEAAFEGVRNLPGPKPDLVVAHGGRGAPTPLLRDILDCPIVNYCEYYFAPSHRDISYRIDLPPAEPAPHFPRCINAPVLVALADCDSGYSATAWQRSTFPPRFHHKIEVHFDGIDDQLYRAGPAPREILGRSIPAGTRVVTFVSRGLESVRGFDLFLEVARRILAERSNVLFLVVGNEDTYYGWDKLHTGRDSFKQWAFEQGDYDPSRFAFLGQLRPEALADLLRISDLHLYLTTPFVLSWSLLNAMSTGLVVLASDVPPVREVIEPGVNGLVEPLFDRDRLAEAALKVLDDPSEYAPLGRAARSTIESRYSVDQSIPPLKDYFERVASTGKGRS
ncbi:glycosyltransferase [Tundrisphaera lichenicola]|uniref:glycosyltransferase n=1 Tax=Tundrisphaera lichenicola TaxID=2029860 RepID=UPI003EB71C07